MASPLYERQTGKADQLKRNGFSYVGGWEVLTQLCSLGPVACADGHLSFMSAF